MAITFTTGTINQPDAPSVGLAMAEKIRDDVIAHAAWDLVEEFTAPAGLVRWYVLKCLATSSGFPSDFYVVIGRTLSTGEIRMFICEQYVAATHTATFWSPAAISTQFTYDGSGRFPNDYVLGTVAVQGTGATPNYCNWIPSGTSTKWWLTVDDDGFTVAFNGAANGFFNCGGYVPLTVLPINMPICLIGSGGSQGTAGMLTRNPALVGATTFAAGLTFVTNVLLGFAGDLRFNDKLQNNQRPMAEQGMTIQSVSFGDMANTGWALGKHKRMRVTTGSAPAGVAFGDAYVMGGQLWVPYLPSDVRIWNTGVASS